jgi:hypothetical protein
MALAVSILGTALVPSLLSMGRLVKGRFSISLSSTFDLLVTLPLTSAEELDFLSHLQAGFRFSPPSAATLNVASFVLEYLLAPATRRVCMKEIKRSALPNCKCIIGLIRELLHSHPTRVRESIIRLRHLLFATWKASNHSLAMREL